MEESSPAVWEWVLGIGLLLVILALALHAVSPLVDDLVDVARMWPIPPLGP